MFARTRCSNHCAACGRCFASLQAFDLHRAGDHAVRRYCAAPADEPRLAAATEAGRCEISGATAEDGSPLTLDPVSIWTMVREQGGPACADEVLAPSEVDPDPDPQLALVGA